VGDTDRVHVEHIYPQTPDGPKWPDHSQIINRLGNLTLLGRRLNTSIKNADFATKKERGYAGSDIMMTKELLPLDRWDLDAINERQRELSTWVFDIWKFPGEATPTRPDTDAVLIEHDSTAEIDDGTLDNLPDVPE
jgi:hypothetical protein